MVGLHSCRAELIIMCRISGSARNVFWLKILFAGSPPVLQYPQLPAAYFWRVVIGGRGSYSKLSIIKHTFSKYFTASTWVALSGLKEKAISVIFIRFSSSFIAVIITSTLLRRFFTRFWNVAVVIRVHSAIRTGQILPLDKTSCRAGQGSLESASHVFMDLTLVNQAFSNPSCYII